MTDSSAAITKSEGRGANDPARDAGQPVTAAPLGSASSAAQDRGHPFVATGNAPGTPAPSAASTPQSRQRIRDLASAVIAGYALHPRNDYELRLGLAVVRYVNGLDPGDVQDEYALVKEALT